jgi:hypothetical protein
MAEQRDGTGDHRPASAGRALLWTIGSAVLPGIAHLRVGRRAAGWTILSLFVVLLAFGIAAVVLLHGDLTLSAQLAVQGRWLLTAAAGAFVIAVLWMTVIVHSWVITKPADTKWFSRFVGAGVVLALYVVYLLFYTNLTTERAQGELREAWEGSISPFSKVFVVGLLFVLFAGSLLAIAMLFVALVG